MFAVINDLVRLKVAPIHPLLRRAAALAYTRRWWSILAMGAQSAAIDCIFGRDPQASAAAASHSSGGSGHRAGAVARRVSTCLETPFRVGVRVAHWLRAR